MARVGLAKVVVLSPFTSFLAAGGCPLERHLTSFGIDPRHLANPDCLVPLHWACDFIDGLGRLEGIDEIGFEVGSRSSITDLGSFGGILAQSLTLKDLVERMLIWVPHFDSGAKIWIEPGSANGFLRLCVEHDAEAGRSAADAFGLLILIDAVRMALGPDWKPEHFWIDPAAGNPRAYEALDSGDAHPNTTHFAFEIPKAKLGMPLQARRTAPSVDKQLESTAPKESLIGSLTQAIESSLGSRLPVVQEAAALAGMSPRSLQRLLGRQGLSYRNLVDRIRYRHATAMLTEDNLPISEISRHLGYQSAANFTHAFRRWTNESPTAFRKRSMS